VDGEPIETAQHQPVAVGPVQLVPRYGQADVGEAFEQRGERDPGFETGERGAQAEVDAVPEPEVGAHPAGDVEPLRVVVHVRITVRGREAHQQLLVGRNDDPSDLQRLRRDAERGVRDGGRESDELLDRVRDQARVANQCLQLGRVVEQRDEPVADQARRGVVPCHEQLEQARQHLLAGETPVVCRGHQHADQVVGGLVPMVGDHPLEVPDDFGGCGDGLRRWCASPGLEQRAEPVVELGPIALGDAEQFTDHREREGVGVPRDEVDLQVVAGGGEPLEQVVRDAQDRGFECRDSARGERTCHDATQAGVVGRVDVEHVPREGGAGEAAVDDVGIVGERRHHVL
jgi:hypothetical protein